MAASGVSRANENKAIRQEALREQLSKAKHVEHVIEMVNKIADLDTELDSGKINRLKIASELKMRLVNKYLPDLKQQEITIDADVVAKEKTRKELEAKLSEAGIDWAALDA